jgi:hypothetical protein
MYKKAKTCDKGIGRAFGDAGVDYECFETLDNPGLKDREMKIFRMLMKRDTVSRTWRLIELALEKTVWLLCAERAH